MCVCMKREKSGLGVTLSFSRRYLFHVMVEKDIVYLCLTDQDLSRRVAFAFLDDIHEHFYNVFSPTNTDTTKYAFSQEFNKVLQRRMEFFSYEPNAERITQVLVVRSMWGCFCAQIGHVFMLSVWKGAVFGTCLLCISYVLSWVH